MKAGRVSQDRKRPAPYTKSSTLKIKDTLLPTELRIDGSLRIWPYVFDHGEQKGKTLEDCPFYACHLIHRHNSEQPILDVALRTALARFAEELPESLSNSLKDFDPEASSSSDDNDNPILRSKPAGNFQPSLRLSEDPDYVLNFGKYNGRRLSTIPDNYIYWLMEQVVSNSWKGDPALKTALFLFHREHFIDPEFGRGSKRYQEIYNNFPDESRFNNPKTKQPFMLSKSQATLFFGLEDKHLEVLVKTKTSLSRPGVINYTWTYWLRDLWYVTSVHKSVGGARHGVRSFLQSKNVLSLLEEW